MSRRPVGPRSPYDKASFRITPGLAQPLDPRDISIAERTGRRIMHTLHRDQQSEASLTIAQRHDRKTLGTIVLACATAAGLALGIAGYEVLQSAHDEVRSRQNCQEFTYDQFATDPQSAASELTKAIHANVDSYRSITAHFGNDEPVELCDAARYSAEDLITYRVYRDTVTTTLIAPSSTIVSVTPQS